ncbi:MAG: hypothetical protein H7257_14115 [Taibaiella sp.]|nr:hypothetical protein [Taibaiella sp.]
MGDTIGISGKKRTMYHSQKRKSVRLSEPIICTKDNAWLGVAWYFWYDLDDAVFWGNSAKRTTGYYKIYIADIDFSNVLDTVFNEEHYIFWVKQMEKIKKKFAITGQSPTLKQLNDYFLQKGIWSAFSGIMFRT